MSFISLTDHTVAVCYYSETNTSQQLHKLDTVNNVPLFNNAMLKSDLSSSKLVFQEHQRLWLNNQLPKDTPNTTPQQFLTKISATCVILELPDFRSKSLQDNRAFPRCQRVSQDCTKRYKTLPSQRFLSPGAFYFWNPPPFPPGSPTQKERSTILTLYKFKPPPEKLYLGRLLHLLTSSSLCASLPHLNSFLSKAALSKTPPETYSTPAGETSLQGCVSASHAQV